MPRATLQNQLIEQREFLASSLKRFAEGYQGEALRIATTIRVLVHETPSSNPLLKQVDPDYLKLTVLDAPTPTPSKPGGYIPFYIGVGVQVSIATGVQPIFDLEIPGLRPTPIRDWWNRELLIFTDDHMQRMPFTRKSLLLTLANKEGGAHVDTSLPAAYEKFVIDSPLKFMMNAEIRVLGEHPQKTPLPHVF